MASKEYGALSPQALYEFDNVMSTEHEGSGIVVDFESSRVNGELGYLVSKIWEESGSLSLYEALPVHIKDLKNHV